MRRPRRPPGRARPGGPFPTSTVATPSVSIPPIACDMRRITPPESFGKSAIRRTARRLFPQHLLRAPRNLPSPLLFDLGRGQHDASLGAPDRLGEREVGVEVAHSAPRTARRRRSPSGLSATIAVDHLAVQPARERPAHLQLVEGDVVDLHDDEVVRGRVLVADREARVDRVELEFLEGVRRVGEHAQRRQRDPDARGSAPSAADRSAMSSAQLAASRAVRNRARTWKLWSRRPGSTAPAAPRQPFTLHDVGAEQPAVVLDQVGDEDHRARPQAARPRPMSSASHTSAGTNASV